MVDLSARSFSASSFVRVLGSVSLGILALLSRPGPLT